MKILLVSSLFPSDYKPSEGTFTHRWAKQLILGGCEVLGFSVQAITPATLLRTPKHFFIPLLRPKRFHYVWKEVPISALRVIVPIPGGQRSRLQPWLIFRSIRNELDRLFQNNPYDILWIGQGGPIAQATARYARLRNIPYVASAIGDGITRALNNPESFDAHRERQTLMGSQSVLCVSEDMKQKVLKLTDGRCHPVTFYSGVDTKNVRPNPDLRKQFRKRLALNPDHFNLLFVGHLIKPKGIYELLSVFHRLVQKRPEIRLVMVGFVTEKKSVQKTIQTLSLGSKVTLTGGIDHEEVLGYFNAADLFVFPSWSEGLPNAVMEACAHALPVIATHVDGIPELIVHTKTGILIPPNNEKKLEEAIEYLIDFPKIGTQLGIAARKNMENNFNYHTKGPELVELFSKLLFKQ